MCSFLVNLERWCRLRGNLLFYFKSRDQFSEPLGVIVLEQCTVTLDPSPAPLQGNADAQFGFYLGKQTIGTLNNEIYYNIIGYKLFWSKETGDKYYTMLHVGYSFKNPYRIESFLLNRFCWLTQLS